ncbi:hypothetical protein EZJ43_11775 [Pedobacter changchengzhani]|uniref:Uncharacterized protein n=1 Tax=Pedobacter changchengzhani TaxID=2529274 RepID=A0A4R5MJA0_9SPHI|nr:hypothetical protein [Pedobacter changchengzhani]TDG35694.1 hypothetical protein EZJ43_11775 [Pedobacter changchengzhani]
MSNRGKKIFLACSVILPMLLYCYIYYKPILQNAPFRAKDFVSMEYSWGRKDTLENRYSSVTGVYEYLNSQDSLIKRKMFLKSDDILYMHTKANEIGLWNFPDTIGYKSNKHANTRYDMVFRYKEKTKHVVLYSNFDGNPKLLDAAVQMRKVIEETLNLVEKRTGY